MSAQRPERTTGGLLEEALTRSVIGSFYDVHRELGFGYRELIYALALERALVAKGHRVDREAAVMVYFRGEEEPEVSYKDKGGKYQSQVGVTLPKL